jgi:hypothetical protein
MIKETILYARFKKPDIPKDKKLLISTDNKKVYYRLNNKDIVVKDLDIFSSNKYSFMKLRLSSQNKSDDRNEYIDILIDIDLNDYIKLLENKSFSNGRKNFFQLMKKCYEESRHNYIGNITLNMFEDTLKVEEDDISWMLLRENNNIIYKDYPKFIFKIGKNIIDLNIGTFTNVIDKDKEKSKIG